MSRSATTTEPIDVEKLATMMQHDLDLRDQPSQNDEADRYLDDVEELVRREVGPRRPYSVARIEACLQLDRIHYGFPQEWTLANVVQRHGRGRFAVKRGKLVVKHLTPRQGKDRRWFGHYRCVKCGRSWQSAFSWVNKHQACKGCEKRTYPFRQDEFRQKDDDSDSDDDRKRPHDQARCGKCRELGYTCSVSAARF